MKTGRESWFKDESASSYGPIGRKYKSIIKHNKARADGYLIVNKLWQFVKKQGLICQNIFEVNLNNEMEV